MSTIQTNSITDAAGTGAPDFPNGIEVSAGNVGIGTASPVSPLHVYLTDATTYGDGTAALDTTNLLRVQNDSEVNDTYSGIQLVSENAVGTQGWWSIASVSTSSNYDNHLVFHTRTGFTTYAERMRIDSSGTVLVGKTSDDGGATAGIQLHSEGIGYFTRSGNSPVAFNRLSGDGSIASFRRDGTTVGQIGTTASSFWFGANVEGIGIKLSSDDLRPTNAAGSNSDNVMDLGDLAVRWDDVYATNGTIQTSDANEKQDIEELNDAERRVAVACKGLLRKYRWKDAVAEKGDDARIHFGIIAQDLQAAFAAEGLDAGRYAMFISSTWWEHDGKIYDTAEEAPEGATERTRLGVRYPELLAFMIAVL